MYGILLESVQAYVIHECGEEIWLTILKESGAKNTEFNTQQHYPDTLMLRLASALARIITRDPKSPSDSSPTSPVPKKKTSIKNRSSAKSHSSARNSPARLPKVQSTKCPFTSTALINEITREHIAAYNSSEEIYKSQEEPKTHFIVEYLNEKIMNKIQNGDDIEGDFTSKNDEEGILGKKHSLGNDIGLNSSKTGGKHDTNLQITNAVQPFTLPSTKTVSVPQNDKLDTVLATKGASIISNSAMSRRESSPASPASIGSYIESVSSNAARRSSGFAGTSALRRESGSSGVLSPRTGHSPNCRCAENKAAALKETFGTPEKVMLFFGRCFVKYFSSHGYDMMIRATGRYFCTFLLSVDNIHKRIRFRYSYDMLIRATGLYFCKYLQSVNNIHKRMRFRYSYDMLIRATGRYFCTFLQSVDNIHKRMRFRYSYDMLIRATGRYFCTFLQSVDNIHQRMRFTFPRMRSPTMQLVRMHRLGAELIYSSTRHGFTYYLMGQLYEIAENYFSLKLNISIIKESIEGAYSIVVLRLEFDNSDYVQSLLLRKARPCPLPPVSASLLLQLFPFGLLFDRKMRVLLAGDKLVQMWGGPHTMLRKSVASDILRLRKPKTSFTWDKVVSMQSVLFELELVRWESGTAARGEVRRGSQGIRLVLLKGQMRLLEEIDAVIFLCSPIFNDLEELSNAGLFLADMNGHGLSRQLLLTGWQHCSKLELLFEKAEGRSASLEKSRGLLDTLKKRSDKLLYSMIPKPIVDHLRHEKHIMPGWQGFDCVTVMFCALSLEENVSRAGVMHTVAKINEVYSRIDRLIDSHQVYKVETVGSVYMVVSGAPERTRAHAAAAAGAALAVAHALPALTLGVHSGACVAGVLGHRLPRYCIVGDTVNTASRMQTTSEPGRIQISAATAALLPPGRFRLRRRGLIKVKGKGLMETFWLEGETEEDEQDEALQLFSAMCSEDSDM